jgi:peptidoglycan/LPS O-acetylase OafA/YrhL
MASANQTDVNRVAILDLMRFIAAMFVMLYHYHYYLLKTTADNTFSAFKFGYLGVNFFFMLSGFVIMASAQNRSAIKFALLRALRIYPTFITCLLITIIVMFMFGRELPSLKAILLNGLIVNDYFGIPNIDDVYWTLQAELKFYGCVFLLILFGLLSHYKTWLSIWLLLAIAFHFFNQPFFLGWFISPSYSFFFIGGVSAYFLFKNSKDFYVLGVFLIAMFFATLKSWTQIAGFCKDYEQIDQIIAAAITCLFFLFFFWLQIINSFISFGRWVAILGGMSYPLYLIHSRAGLELVKAAQQQLGVHLALATAIIATLLVALLIHIHIEKPIFKRARKIIK